jgi:hypothetical protein
VILSAWRPTSAAASTACVSSARAPLRTPRSAGPQKFLAGRVGKRYCRPRRITPSVEKWRRQAPHDAPPYPIMPSPTFAHSSSATLLSLLVVSRVTCWPCRNRDRYNSTIRASLQCTFCLSH